MKEVYEVMDSTDDKKGITKYEDYEGRESMGR